ncbi:MAG: hypothetical protein ACO3BD_09425 [Chitinophagaceae bacterium]
MKRITLTVTNELRFDQRMDRICTSLAAAGYQVTLIGRRSKISASLLPKPYRQIRLRCFIAKGPFFYIEYNIRLFFKLLSQKTDCLVAIDLDTILPCLAVSKLMRTQRVYDAHELFCEMKEIVTRPSRYRLWKAIERLSVPQFTHGYTVNDAIAAEFKSMYGSDYAVIRNVPIPRVPSVPKTKGHYILYQGAVNEGRSFETLIPAMHQVSLPLWICGEGNYLAQAKALVKHQ